MFSILTGLNFIVTIHKLRAPSMTWFKMPLFPWSLYASAWIQVIATPIVGITLIMVIFEKILNIGFIRLVFKMAFLDLKFRFLRSFISINIFLIVVFLLITVEHFFLK